MLTGRSGIVALVVPGPGSVAGLSDAAWAAYDLTTFAVDPNLVMQHVLTSLEALARSSAIPGAAVTVDARLIERRSTARRV